MPRKKPEDWLNQEYNAREEKLPTIRQYLKELPNDAKDIKSTVRLVWLPGQWNNFTLETDHFRVIVNPKHKLYGQLRDNFDAFSKGTETLDVVVIDRKSVSYRLNINSEERGEWFFIGGSSGLKFTSEKANGGNPDDAPW
jgi:hypothetical protein